ncbi:AraC family transcriptional regulator [Breoghania corrubedonensis]|uniref:AraC family transcriptional regulator n=1 Tax=Breoghania corrubedonensis TaxID=665038 RepID=A0A2T5VA09_9HYPH|nr:AraC family transcriptional regulator [Breoghania corrubedonensis]PTW60588.1 AraC family transcriptional regulator [Breoghania corrubedonensis]
MKTRRIVGRNFEIAVIWADRLKFTAHAHDEYVLSCNISGNEKLILDGKRLEAPEKFTTLYNPGQIQSGDGTECILSIYLEPDFFIKEELSSNSVIYEKPIVGDDDLWRKFVSLVSIVFDRDNNEIAEEKLYQILDLSMSRYTYNSFLPTRNTCDKRIKRVKELLLSRLADQVSLDEISGELGLDKLGLLRMFVKAEGIPPITWQRVKRIEEARRLLKTGISASDTAYRTGFYDQSHLTRWFGRAYGISPARFMRG